MFAGFNKKVFQYDTYRPQANRPYHQVSVTAGRGFSSEQVWTCLQSWQLDVTSSGRAGIREDGRCMVGTGCRDTVQGSRVDRQTYTSENINLVGGW